MSGEGNKNKWNLYVLRYHSSGNYYVGITESFENRMLIHWRRTSNLPQWSSLNESTKGFKYYWFSIDDDGVSQSHADHCENCLAELLVKKIKEINKEVHVGNGKFVDTEDTRGIEIEVNNIKNYLKDIDVEITGYLKNLKSLETKSGEFSIECCRIGYVEEYNHSQCNKSWDEVARVRMRIEN